MKNMNNISFKPIKVIKTSNYQKININEMQKHFSCV